MQVIIRKVNIDEADTLLQLSYQTFMDAFAAKNNPDDIEAYAAAAFTKAKMATELNTGGSEFYFAVDGEEIAGYLKINSGMAQTEFQSDNTLEIERIYVHAKYQAQKIGGQLIQFAIGKAIQSQRQYIWLGVWEHNLAAIRFYQRNGFKQFSSHYFMLGNDRQTDVLMKLVLK